MTPRLLAFRQKLVPFERLSLKVRLGIVFSGLMLLATLLCSAAIYELHRLGVRGTQIAVREHVQLEKAVQLREALGDIDRYFSRGEISRDKVNRFRKLIGDLTLSATPETAQILESIRVRFESYVASLESERRRKDAARLYEDTAAGVGSLIEAKQVYIYRVAHELRREQETALRAAAIFLSLFLVVLVGGAFKIISAVTQPLSELSRFLDELNFEDELPKRLPGFTWNAPEITRVARSFEQLLHRLRGYRALNVRRLLLEKRRADIIAASIADGIFLLRGEEILYVNPVGERILGLPRDRGTWRGLSLSSPLLSPGAAVVRQTIARTMPMEFELETEDGRKLHYLLQAFPIPESVIEQVEHSFNGPVEQLLDRWQATTLILAQDVSLVRESQQAKSHFIATLSHEVKTPVTSLTMATRLLRKAVEQIPNPTHRSLILTCADDVDRLRGLIDDLLSVSRFDTLAQKLDLKGVDIGKLLKQSVQHFQTDAFEKGISLTITPPDRRVLVPMDATKISWALSNLLTNALRHTPRGGRVEAMVAFTDETAEVRIRDSGPGIERSRQERIFDKFNPFYDLRVARSGSVGMGLAIAREIVIAHGGRIWVTSEPGHGAEFCFTLPLKQGGAAPTGLRSPVSQDLITKGDSSGTSARG